MSELEQVKSDITPNQENPPKSTEIGDNPQLRSFANNNSTLFAMETPNNSALKALTGVTITGISFVGNEDAAKREYTLPVNQATIIGGEAGNKNQIRERQLLSPLRIKESGDFSLKEVGNPVANIDINQKKGTNVEAPLPFLIEAEKLEGRLDIHQNEQGQTVLSVKPEGRDAQGKPTPNTDSPESINQKINENYLAAMQTAAESEPARRQAVAQIDQRLEEIRKDLKLNHIPSPQELEEMKKPENLAKLTPAERQSYAELEQLMQSKEVLEASSLKNVEKRYEDFLERTGQTEALTRFRVFVKPALKTLPFQDSLNDAGRPALLGQSTITDENNPFSYYRKAVDALHKHPPDTAAVERNFSKAIAAAEKLDRDPKEREKLDKEMARVKEAIKAEKEKAQPDSNKLASLKEEEKALTLLKASSGLMNIAYADYLIHSGNPDKAFQHLIAAADNRAAIDIVNQHHQYYEQLMDRSLHGDKNMVTAANQAANHLQDFRDHYSRALSYSNSGDKQKAKEEFEAAYKAAEEAKALTRHMDNRELAKNIKLYDEAIKEERKKYDDAKKEEENKPLEKQKQERIKRFEDTLKRLEQERKTYQELAHLPASASFALAKAEFTLSIVNGKPNAERDPIVRGLIEEAESDPTLRDIPGIGQEIDQIKDFVREQTYGEWTWDTLRRNSGTIAALSAGFAVAGLTCWSGPGAALAGAAAAGAVAGTVTDWAAGNEISLGAFGGHCLEGTGAGVGRFVMGRVAGSALVSRIPQPLARYAVTGAATAGSTGSVQYIPDLVNKGPLVYGGKVALNTTIGAGLGPLARYAGNQIPSMRPIIQSPGVSHAIKSPFTEGLFETGSELSRRSAYILNMR